MNKASGGTDRLKAFLQESTSFPASPDLEANLMKSMPTRRPWMPFVVGGGATLLAVAASLVAVSFRGHDVSNTAPAHQPTHAPITTPVVSLAPTPAVVTQAELTAVAKKVYFRDSSAGAPFLGTCDNPSGGFQGCPFTEQLKQSYAKRHGQYYLPNGLNYAFLCDCQTLPSGTPSYQATVNGSGGTVLVTAPLSPGSDGNFLYTLTIVTDNGHLLVSNINNGDCELDAKGCQPPTTSPSPTPDPRIAVLTAVAQKVYFANGGSGGTLGTCDWDYQAPKWSSYASCPFTPGLIQQYNTAAPQGSVGGSASSGYGLTCYCRMNPLLPTGYTATVTGQGGTVVVDVTAPVEGGTPLKYTLTILSTNGQLLVNDIKVSVDGHTTCELTDTSCSKSLP